MNHLKEPSLQYETSLSHTGLAEFNTEEESYFTSVRIHPLTYNLIYLEYKSSKRNLKLFTELILVQRSGSCNLHLKLTHQNLVKLETRYWW